MFKDKVLMISGGTGSFGNAVLKRFINSDLKEIRIFSRDEKKQDKMRHDIQVYYPDAVNKVKFFIGSPLSVLFSKHYFYDFLIGLTHPLTG